jgi:hypothetical protein
MNNLIIIGNGFDLAHELETSYEQFIRYLVDTNKNDIKHLDLFTQGLHYSYDQLRSNYKENLPIIFEDIIKNKLLKHFLEHHFLRNWSDVEEIYFKLLTEIGQRNSLYKDPIKLNTEFNEIKFTLSNYLAEQEYKSQRIESYNRLFATFDLPSTYIVNFNYTNTLQRLYSTSLSKCKIIHIHGELSNEKNPIIFGYAASDKESRELVMRNKNEYMRNIKKHMYKHAENEAKLTKYLNDFKKIDVSILGHSCGLSDKLILNQILTHENVETVRSFYYENYENYFNTMVNVDRIMEDDDKFNKRVVDFNSSHRMPQINDSDLEKKSIIDYIDKVQKMQFDQRPKMGVSVL